MVTIEDYGNYETAWCPGCGNFSIIKAMKQAMVGLDLASHQVFFFSGIGQAAKTPHYIKGNAFNGLHGRSLPPAQAAKLANRDAVVIVNSGDGCSYGEGGNHFLAALRRNVNMTVLVHDNQIYGLTKGQASPMTAEGHVTKSNPDGVYNTPFKPLSVAVTMNAGFVARGFSGMVDHLASLIMEGVRHPGMSLIDILQPCVSFNKVNTFKWYKERVYEIPDSHDPTDQNAALKLAGEFGDRIPVGVIYRGDREPLDERIPAVKRGPLCRQPVNLAEIEDIMEAYT